MAGEGQLRSGRWLQLASHQQTSPSVCNKVSRKMDTDSHIGPGILATVAKVAKNTGSV